MVEVALAILSVLVPILGSIAQETLSEEGKAKRVKYEEAKSLAQGDSRKLSAQLSHLFDELQR